MRPPGSGLILPFVNAEDLGVRPSNTGKQNSDAIEAAFAEIPLVNGKPTGQRWMFGQGTFLFDRTIEVTRSMALMGSVGGVYGSTLFEFPSGVDGIVLNSNNSAGAEKNSAWSALSNLIVTTSVLGNGENHGISLKGYGAVIEQCYVYGFSGDGFHIQASTQDSPSTIANHWTIRNCRADYNGRHGLFVKGGDSNVGLCSMLDSFNNGGWGILDDSFLGNTYIACQTSTNALGGYYAKGANSNNVFLNCYSESDEKASQIDHPSMVISGTFPGGITGNCVRVGPGFGSPLLFKTPNGFMQAGGGSGGSDSSIYSEYWVTGDPDPLRFKHGQDYANFSGFFGWNVGNANGRSGLMLAVKNSVLKKWPMACDGGRMVVDNQGFYLDQNRMGNGAGLPNYGTHNIGDIRFNTEPVPGGQAGWICTTSGTAGEYVEGRLAESDGGFTISLGSASGVLVLGDILRVNGIVARIIAVDGLKVKMAFPIPPGSGLSISYAPPEWRTFGQISP